MEVLVLEEAMAFVLEELKERACHLEVPEEEASFQELEVQQPMGLGLLIRQSIEMDQTFKDSNLEVLEVLDKNVEEQDGQIDRFCFEVVLNNKLSTKLNN